MEVDTPSKWQLKKMGIALLTSDKIDFKSIKVTRHKNGHYIIIKGTINQEDVTVINIYAPNIGASKYTKQLLIDAKGEIDGNTIIVADFATPLTSIDRSSRQKVCLETVTFNEIFDQMDLMDLYKTFHPNAEEYVFFSSRHGTFTINVGTQNISIN